MLYVFGSVRDLCAKQNIILATSSISSGWRYFLFSNNTLKAAASLSPDYDYASAWLQLLNYTRQMYNNLTKAFSTWLNATMAASKTAANASLSNFLATLPKATITIKMDESTSTWLKTTLNVLKTYQITGASSSFGTVTVPAVPTAEAPAAASAVAVAWAASRRDDDVVTAAAIAGIALALFGILMTLIYGTSSLTLVALGIIVAAAAAAWKKI
jgi:VIT1/CCC1 family predicted Fe2+/Mn2+ transporter